MVQNIPFDWLFGSANLGQKINSIPAEPRTKTFASNSVGMNWFFY